MTDLPGFRPNVFTRPPFEPWQLTEDPDGVWGVRSAAGINVLGANDRSPGSIFTDAASAAAIADHWNSIAEGAIA